MWKSGHTDLARLLQNSIRWVAGTNPPVAIEGEGVIEAFANWTGAWTDYRVEVEELTDLGADVLARTRHRGRGKDSGADVDMQIFQVWTLRNDKVVRARMYYDEAEAREALTN